MQKIYHILCFKWLLPDVSSFYVRYGAQISLVLVFALFLHLAYILLTCRVCQMIVLLFTKNVKMFYYFYNY